MQNLREKETNLEHFYTLVAAIQHTRREKMAALPFTTTPCEPNTAMGTKTVIFFFGEVRPCTSNIVYARDEVFRTFLCVFYESF